MERYTKRRQKSPKNIAHAHLTVTAKVNNEIKRNAKIDDFFIVTVVIKRS